MIRFLEESEVAKRIEIDENGGTLLFCVTNIGVFTLDSWATNPKEP